MNEFTNARHEFNDSNVQPCFSMSVANGVLEVSSDKVERFKCEARG